MGMRLEPASYTDHHVETGGPRLHYQDYGTAGKPPMLNEAVEKLDLRDFVLLGHSLGGVVSTLYAATYPGRARRLIVIDSTVNTPPGRKRNMLPGAMLGSGQSARNRRQRPDARKEQD
ncbi:MAG: alpha/beta fold hydrolase [Pseudomonadota bacterium]